MSEDIAKVGLGTLERRGETLGARGEETGMGGTSISLQAGETCWKTTKVADWGGGGGEEMEA